MNKKKTKRNLKILILALTESVSEAARSYEISRTRVHQICMQEVGYLMPKRAYENFSEVKPDSDIICVVAQEVIEGED